MAKKYFTDESLATLVDETKSYTDNAVSKKADSSHTHSVATTSANGMMSSSDKSKLNGIASGAQVNQNAFSNVTVGSTTIAADSTTDTLTIAAGTGISVSGDATNDKVTITNSGVRSISTGGSNGTISVNTNGTSADVAVKGLGSAAYTNSSAYDAAGSASAVQANLDIVSDTLDGSIKSLSVSGRTITYTKNDGSTGTITTQDSNTDTKVGVAVDDSGTTALPLLFATGTSAYTGTVKMDTGVKLTPSTNTISANISGNAATATTADTANAVAWGNVTNKPSTFTPSSHTHDDRYYTETEIDNKFDALIGEGGSATLDTIGEIAAAIEDNQDMIDTLNSAIGNKQATITGAATTITSSNLTASRALISNGSGKVAVSDITSTELGYLDGVTKNIQTQLDGKAASSHNHAASNITSGTLSSDRLPTVPITKGGTGATTAAAALTNLGITATASELNIMDGVTATTAEINKLDGITASTAELNYVDGVTSNIQTQLNSKLDKTTYEWSKEVTFGATGKLCIGKFPMYDSNITVEISATTSTAYNATLVIASQNINTSGGGTLTPVVYGDASNTIAPNIYIGYASGSNVVSVYFSPTAYSKNLIHIQCVALAGTPTDICTSVSAIPSTATRKPTNALTSNFASSSHTHSAATTSVAGLMSASDKSKLDGITASADSVSFSRSLTSGTKVGTITINGTGTDLYAPTNTDTHYTTHLYAGDGTAADKATTNGNTKITVTDNSTVRDSITIKGSGATTVSSDANGVITISSTDNNTTYTLGSFGITATATELNYVDGVTSNVQTQLNAKAPKASPVFTGSISLGRKADTTVGSNSFAVGNNVTASANYSHAEGWNSVASGQTSHAEGESEASGECAHSEGIASVASGDGSHAEGEFTIASGEAQHVQGTYNVEDDDNTYAHIVGNGYLGNRSNAHVLDWDGNAYFKGNVYVRGTNADASGGKQVATTDVVSTSANGLAPKLAGGTSKYLRADGTWVTPPNTTYSAATTSTAGLMSATDKSKLDGIASGANKYSLPTASSSTLGGVKTGSNITNSSGTISLTKANVTSALGYTPPTTNTTYSNMTGATSSAAGAAGLVPAPAAGKQSSFLRGDGTWVVPTNTTYSNFVKSGSGAKAGLVPAPSTTAGTTKYLREDGTWTTPPDTNTTYSAATTSASGLMTAAMVTKLNGIATGANAYSLPTAGSSLGGVKTTSTVTSTSGLTACPIISGVPYYKDTNTTYSSLKNPYSLTIQGNGTTLTNGTYDGSAAKTVNITPASIGAAASSHTHAISDITGLTPVLNQSFTSEYFDVLFSYCGDVKRVHFAGYTKKAINSGGPITVCTITNSKLIPKVAMSKELVVGNYNGSPLFVSLNIQTDGKVTIWNRQNIASNQDIYIDETYI